jgi:hypothetical protein
MKMFWTFASVAILTFAVTQVILGGASAHREPVARLANDSELATVAGADQTWQDRYCVTASYGCPTCSYQGDGIWMKCNEQWYNGSCVQTGSGCVLQSSKDCGTGWYSWNDPTCQNDDEFLTNCGRTEIPCYDL